MTDSEKYVSKLCEKSFFQFWSFPNPIGKNNKELCDILIVCGDIIIIISVKDIKMSNHSDDVIKYERWVKKAIDDSAKQIYGAEKFIQNSDEVLLNDYKTKISLPKKENRKIYRIAIAFGSSPNFPLPMGDFGKGYISVFDEKSTAIIFSELDTITDFTKYIDKKESLQSTIIAAYETDYLAFYIQTGLDFDTSPDSILIEDNLWESYIESHDYKIWKNESTVSYIWDFFIFYLFSNQCSNRMDNEKFLELEEAVRIINLEDRNSRISLGNNLESALKEKVQARMIQPDIDKDYTYVFMPLSDENWDFKQEELLLRCDVARYCHPHIQKVIGISIGTRLINDKETPIFDLCYINVPEITPEFKEHVENVQKKMGYFTNPRISD